MSENTRQQVNGAVLLVMSVILTASVAFLAWVAQTVYNMHGELAAVKNQQTINSQAIKDIQDKGSPIIQAVMVRLDNLAAGQSRIERSLEQHMKPVP
jgi:hypothetical protein